jgi:hypothetical protein
VTEHSVSCCSVSSPADPMPFGIPDDQVDFDTPSAAALADSNFSSTPPGPVPASQNSPSPAQACGLTVTQHTTACRCLYAVVHMFFLLTYKLPPYLTAGQSPHDAVTCAVTCCTHATRPVVTTRATAARTSFAVPHRGFTVTAAASATAACFPSATSVAAAAAAAAATANKQMRHQVKN